MSHWNTIREFRTARFRVLLQWEPEQDEDLSWVEYDDLAKFDTGEWTNCTFRVAVFLDGRELAATYLGNSVYADPADFGREHYGTAGTGAGGYFSDMLREVIQEARRRIRERPPLPRLREAVKINYARR